MASKLVFIEPSSPKSMECCMCGDCGLVNELFRCKLCHFRSQHRYCSNIYPKAESNRVCNWCLKERETKGTHSSTISSSISLDKRGMSKLYNRNIPIKKQRSLDKWSLVRKKMNIAVKSSIPEEKSSVVFRTKVRSVADDGGENVLVSNKEQKIWLDLELEIENELEQEIKDGISCLALRLHQLYQHRRERIAREVHRSGSQLGKEVALFTTEMETTIEIQMEGGSTIEVKEIKKERRRKGQSQASISVNGKSKIVSPGKGFEQMNTPPSGVSKKYGTSSSKKPQSTQ